MADLCKAGLWDIQPDATCPVCGALPDTECLRAARELAFADWFAGDVFLPPWSGNAMREAFWAGWDARQKHR